MDNLSIKKIITNAIDLHFHIGPEIIPRKFENIQDLISQESTKIGGFALKNHFYSTVPLVKAVKNKSQLKLIGGIVLNNYSGGLNPDSIYSASLLTTEPFIVWMPTINSQNFLDHSKYEIPPEWVQIKNFKTRLAREIKGIKVLNKYNNLLPEAINVLKAVKKANAILATGHISGIESRKLVEKAVKMDIKKIILTHPIYQRINMPIEMQIKLTKLGCYSEICFSMYSIDNISINLIVNQISQLGADRVILSSDVGQKFSPNASNALELFAYLLFKKGVSLKKLETMLVKNPTKLIS